MEFREANQRDLDYMAEHSVSGGCFHEQPLAIDLVYALEDEIGFLGVGGIKMMNAHTAWVWVDWTQYAKNRPRMAYRVIKEWLAAFMSQKGIVRLMAAVDVEFPEAINMCEHLGFHRESIMKFFLGDRDAYCYVKIGEQ